jgi:hypothetical protein
MDVFKPGGLSFLTSVLVSVLAYVSITFSRVSYILRVVSPLGYKPLSLKSQHLNVLTEQAEMHPDPQRLGLGRIDRTNVVRKREYVAMKRSMRSKIHRQYGNL